MTTQMATMTFPKYTATKSFSAEGLMKGWKNMLVLAIPMGTAIGILVNVMHFMH